MLSINRQFYEVGAGLGVPGEVSGGWQSFWCGVFHFQMSHFFRSSVPVGKAQPWALNLTCLGCSWGDLPLFVLSLIQECAGCSGSCRVLGTDLVLSWLPCFKDINSKSILFWKNWQPMGEVQSWFKSFVKGWGLGILSSDWPWCLQFNCCPRWQLWERS